MIPKAFNKSIWFLCLGGLLLLSFRTAGDPPRVWRAERPLTWEDFQGQPDFRSEKTAYTKSRIKSKWSYTGDKLTYKVYAIFEPSNSWARKPKTDHLLAHEQLHFDITEAYARMLRREFARIEDPETMGSDGIKAITRGVREEWHRRQKEFDRETDHSVNEEAEARWRAEIKAMLESMSDYSTVVGSNK